MPDRQEEATALVVWWCGCPPRWQQMAWDDMLMARAAPGTSSRPGYSLMIVIDTQWCLWFLKTQAKMIRVAGVSEWNAARRDPPWVPSQVNIRAQESAPCS